MSPDDQSPKLHIDSDWKAEAQAEKERLATEEKARAEKADPGAGGPQELPEANFRTLMSVLASQALMGLGTMKDPQTGGVMVDLDGSRFSIDLLAVLEEKTKGNLEEDEAKELTHLVSELRSRFVQVTQLVSQSDAAPGAGGALSPEGPAGAVPTSPIQP